MALAVAVVPSGSPAAEKASVLIVEQGRSRAAIHTPASPTEVLSFAASELQAYLRKISGAALPIRAGGPRGSGPAIVLERANLDPPRQALEVDSFTIKCEGARLRLRGNTDRAVLYAAYGFLESLGCAWLEPGEAGEIVPRMPTIAVSDLDLRCKPSFDLRGVCLYGKEENKEEAIDWMGKMRMNTALYPPKGYQKRGIQLQKWNAGHNFGLRLGLFENCAEVSPQDPSKGHVAPKNWAHDPSIAKYAAMIKGKRSVRSLWSTEVCLSNPEAVAKMDAATLQFVEKNPNVFLIDVRADDVANNWCECPECSKYTSTDLFIKYVNQLAAKVYRRWPGKKIMLISYLDTMSPPKKVLPDTSMGNMVLWFAPFSRRYSQPINSSTAEKTPLQFPVNKAVWLKTDGGWLPFLRAWRDAFSGPIFILDYYHWANQDTGSGCFYTRPNVIAADLRFYHELGISGSIGVEYSPQNLPNFWNQHLKAKLLWDPSQDVTELERRYDEQFYGSCASAARKCLATMVEVLNAERNDAGSVAKLERAAATFAAEAKACEKTPAVADRLERISLWAKCVVLRKQYYRRLAEKDADASKKAETDLVDFVASNRAKIARYYSSVNNIIPPRLAQRMKAAKQ